MREKKVKCLHVKCKISPETHQTRDNVEGKKWEGSRNSVWEGPCPPLTPWKKAENVVLSVSVLSTTCLVPVLSWHIGYDKRTSTKEGIGEGQYMVRREAIVRCALRKCTVSCMSVFMRQLSVLVRLSSCPSVSKENVMFVVRPGSRRNGCQTM